MKITGLISTFHDDESPSYGVKSRPFGIGIGFEGTHRGRFFRVAAMLPPKPSASDLKTAWELLDGQVRNFDPSKAVFDTGVLKGKEMQTPGYKKWKEKHP